MSQNQRILDILMDGKPHSSFELVEQVYHSDHPCTARLSARIFNLKYDKKYGYNGKNGKGNIIGWHDEVDPTKYWYQLVNGGGKKEGAARSEPVTDQMAHNSPLGAGSPPLPNEQMELGI